MAARNIVSAGGFSGGKLSFKMMSERGRLCTLQENPQCRVPRIKVSPPDGNCNFYMIFSNYFNVFIKG